MSVRRDSAIAERARVGHEPDFRRRFEIGSEHVVAAVGKLAPDRQARRTRVQAREIRIGTDAQQPARLVVEPARLELEITAAE